MSIKEWLKSPKNSLSGWEDRSFIVCPLFEIKYEKNRKEKYIYIYIYIYEVSRNGYGSLAMFQELKSFHCKGKVFLMLLCCKGFLSVPQVKNWS